MPTSSGQRGERFESLRNAFRSARLLFAAKAALAVGIAWALAPHMPGVTDEYPYYAPLGALLSMYPTLMESARSGLQTLFGLVVGIALALIVVATVGPNWWTIPVVAGIGVLLSGTGWFGVGKEYVPIAALFVLIIGGQNSEDYSLGYVSQMAVGVAVGLAVNLLIVPRVLTGVAAARVDSFGGQLARHLHEVGEAVSESWPPERDEWVRDAAALADTSREVRQALDEADASRKGNPRAMRGRYDTSDVHDRLEALELIAVRIRDISEALADTIWERPGGLGLNPALAQPLSEACHRVADCIPQDGDDGADAHRTRESAARAVRLLLEEVNRLAVSSGQAIGPGVLICMHLRRILLLLRARE
ncbi:MULTISPECIES: FUSC family protein [Microbacterium]|uniref:FUSC family protein n=1 Tax=Microbacterium profundi TaxID=450380 RepID=A0ABV3LGA9_9MICO|nr:FUSC family protein [Microbacterium profundi]MCE7482995.1 aromatic acid exporter family protein [Microbacterium profundi]